MRPPPALLLLLGLLLPACASHARPAESVPTGGATVRVENRSTFDMDIYVERQDGRARLGFAPAGETTRFTLAPGLIAGSGLVRFSARPTRGGDSALSDAFTVHAGDELAWVIPQ